MISEWMKVMLEEISRKKAEAEQARIEAEQARMEAERARIEAGETGDEQRRDDERASPRAPRPRRRSVRRPRQAR
jgi:uncharacterized protein involved in exopolysaccharide biosynthesis